MQKECFSMVGGGQCTRNVLVWSVVVNAKGKFQCGRWWSMQKECFSVVGGGQCKRNLLVWSLAYQDPPVQYDGAGKTTMMIISRSQGPSLS